VPRTITNLTGFHNLETIEASLETLSDVASLMELRAFSVCIVKREHASNLCKAVKNMRHLVHLTIATSDNENQILPLEALDLPGTLSKLVLQGCLEKERMPQIISSWLQLKSLTKLSLISSKLDEVSFSSLMELRDLCYLELVQAYDGKKLYFSESSFPRLQRLGIFSATQLNQVQIEEGALENLEELRFNNCPNLECIPQGIEYLTAIEELYLENIAEELVEKLIKQESGVDEFNEELAKISHIKLIFVMSTEKKYRKRIVPSRVKELAG
jgi:disease resistance protein RPM1